jgi:sugar porter (SP) family MFS transporter
MFGCFFGGWTGDILGRRRGVSIGGLICLIGGTLQAASMNANMFICARVISGIGIGYINSIVCSWISELAKSHNRGFTFSIVFSANYLGLMLITWILYAIEDWTNPGLIWRFPLGCVCAPTVIILSTVWFIPESPRWLVGHGQAEEAREILAKVRGDLALDDPILEAEMQELIAVVELSHKKRNNLLNIWLCGRHSGRLHLGRRAVLAWAALFLMMYTGIMAMATYAGALFEASGASGKKVGWMAGLLQTFGFLGTLAGAPLIDRFGRRVSFLTGLVIQLVVLFLSAAFAKMAGDTVGATSEAWGSAAAAMVYIYQFTFCCTTLVVCWVYPTEIWPQEIRAKGNAFGILGWAMGAGSTTLALPSMFQALGWKTLMVFACFNVVSLPLVYFFFPETANRSLEEVNLLFSLDNPLVHQNEAEYQRMLFEANGNAAVAERRLLDSVDESTGEMDIRLEGAVPKSIVTQHSTAIYTNEKEVHHVQHMKESSLNSSGNEDIE